MSRPVLGCVVFVLSAGTAFASEIVASRTLPAGTVIAPGDLRLHDEADPETPGLGDLVGFETVRALYAGRAVTPGDVRPPTLVEKNAIVEMRFLGQGVEIRAEGRAMDRGSLGERIRVMNLSSRNQVVAVVRSGSLVEVTP